MAIYKHADGICSISSRQVWLPGRYVDERTAKYAFRFPDEVLSRLQEERNNDGTCVISFEDLQAARKLRTTRDDR